ncbi:unnamed protein product [Symbiodinium sp. KB8]|nr:unnamed protein product [Symbiodinium sp. KB8]
MEASQPLKGVGPGHPALSQLQIRERAAKVRCLPPYTARQWSEMGSDGFKDTCCSLPKGRYSRASGGLCFAKPWLDALPGIVAGIERETTPLLPCSVLQGLPVPSEPEHLQARPPKLIGTETLDIWGTEAVVRLQSSYQQAACSPEKPIVIEAHAGKDYIETVVVPEQPEILAESETAAQVITAPATSATFGRTAVKARMVQGARFRSARFAGQGPSISQRKQRRRVGARLRAVSAVYEMPPMPFDASRVRFQIQIGLNTNPRPRAPKARSQPVHESAERMVSAAELLRASYMCEERETLDTSSLACEARLLASAHRGAGAVAASR